MNINRYRRKHFQLEFALLAVQLLPYIIEISPIVITLVSILMLYAKFHVEGFRLNILILAVAWLTYVVVGLGVTHKTTLAVFLLCILKFKVYDIPLTKQNVGHRQIHLGEAEIEIFYPTETKICRRNKRLFGAGVWNAMFNIINKDTEHQSKLPRWAIYLACHYYTRMKMHNTYPDAKLTPGTYPIMLLSHQLGCNSLYSFAREFVDNGYVVISLIHTEVIRNLLPGIEANRPQRFSQLKDRVNDVKRALDFAFNKQKLADIFGEDLKLDFNRVNIFGHSFGGSTAISATIEDSRINGLVIAMDPCLYILQDDLTYVQQQLPYRNKTLIILAEDYYQSHYPAFQNDYRVNIFRRNCQPGSLLTYRFLGSNHASFSDMSLITEGQFKMLGVLRNNSNTLLYLELTSCMIKALISCPAIDSQQELLDIIVKQNPKLKQNILGVVRPLSHQLQERRFQLYCESKKTIG